MKDYATMTTVLPSEFKVSHYILHIQKYTENWNPMSLRATCKTGLPVYMTFCGSSSLQKSQSIIIQNSYGGQVSVGASKRQLKCTVNTYSWFTGWL